MVLIVIETCLLFAGVTLRARVVFVPFDLDEVAVVDLNLQAAVDAAQNAGGVLPRVRVRRGGRGHARSSLFQLGSFGARL